MTSYAFWCEEWDPIERPPHPTEQNLLAHLRSNWHPEFCTFTMLEREDWTEIPNENYQAIGPIVNWNRHQMWPWARFTDNERAVRWLQNNFRCDTHRTKPRIFRRTSAWTARYQKVLYERYEQRQFSFREGEYARAIPPRTYGYLLDMGMYYAWASKRPPPRSAHSDWLGPEARRPA